MKESKTKQLCDTAVVQLRRITDPTFTVGDRVVQSMAQLASDIEKYAGKKKNDANMNDLRQLAKIGQRLAKRSRNNAGSPVEVTVIPDAASDANDKRRPVVRSSARIAAKANELIRVERAKIDAMFPPFRS